MRFKYIPSRMPALAWAAVVPFGGDIVKVYHGNRVECSERFFVSGVWAGKFEDIGFCNSTFFCGTGGVLLQTIDNQSFTPPHTSPQTKINSLIISTNSTPLDALYHLEKDEVLLFSNSFPCLLSVANEELDPNYLGYESAFCSSQFGTKGFVKDIPLKSGKLLFIHRCENIYINNGRIVKIDEKKSGLWFDDYNDYKVKISETVSNLVDNSRSRYRKHVFGLVSTISQGYDAPAVSVWARECGCNEIITFNRPHPDDCGTAIALKLGYQHIFEEDEHSYLKNKGMLEAEGSSCCAGHTFSAFDEITGGKLFFMGTRGDSVWARQNPNVNNDLDFSYGNQFSQACLVSQEHDYRACVVEIPVPMIGSDAWEDIHAISNSEEMLHWSVGGKYDRPIPRRLLEEMGIRRDEFGRKKQGAGSSFHFNTFKSLHKKMSHDSYQSLKHYKQHLNRNRWKWLLFSIRYYWVEMPMYLNHICKKIHIKSPFSTKKCGLVDSPTTNLMILWGVDEMKKRYKEIIL